MTTKKVLLALAATSILAFGYVAPVYAEDPPAPPPADTGTTTTDVPADPDSTAPAPAAPDSGAKVDTGTDSGEQQPQK